MRKIGSTERLLPLSEGFFGTVRVSWLLRGFAKGGQGKERDVEPGDLYQSEKSLPGRTVLFPGSLTAPGDRTVCVRRDLTQGNP
jgi:hypothetical protein